MGIELSHRKPCVLIIGQAGPARGFSRVLRSLCEHLNDQYEIHQFGYDCYEEQTKLGWTLHPNQNRSDFYGLSQIGPLITQLGPQLVLLMNDVWRISLHTRLLQAYRPHLKIVAYCPLEGPIRDPRILTALSGVDRLVLYNCSARRIVENCRERISNDQPRFVFPNIDIIPHGVDIGIFNPSGYDIHGFAERRMAARQLLFAEAQHPDSFIVLNANRNQPRKRIDITVRGFSLFARDKPKHVKLYLHTELNAHGSDLWHLAKNYGLGERLLTTRTGGGHPSVSDAELNLIYNTADVGINTSTGEGWGLVSFEHAATGAAQVVPRHSACEELWENSAVMLDTTNGNARNLVFHQAVVSDEAVAGALERLYQDHHYRRQMSIAAYAKATSAEYQWKSIAQQWARVFDDLNQENTGPAAAQ